MWRSILEAQSLVRRGATKRVGSGQNVSFLQDSWFPYDDPYMRTRSEGLIRKLVHQLMHVGENSWDLELLHDMFEERDFSLIVSLPLSIDEDDSWYWSLDRLGHYTVKSAYQLTQSIDTSAEDDAVSGCWRKLWNFKVPTKVKAFL